MVEAGEEKPIQGLLEQWLREGRMSETEAVMSSTSMFAAGVDTMSFLSIKIGSISVSAVLDITYIIGSSYLDFPTHIAIDKRGNT